MMNARERERQCQTSRRPHKRYPVPSLAIPLKWEAKKLDMLEGKRRWLTN